MDNFYATSLKLETFGLFDFHCMDKNLDSLTFIVWTKTAENS